MSQHKPKYVYSDRDGVRQHRVSCLECGECSNWCPQKWECEDWWNEHRSKIESIKAHLGSHNPSLKAQATYYQRMAEDPKTDPGNRPLWQQLADELNHRLNASGADDQDPLFDMP